MAACSPDDPGIDGGDGGTSGSNGGSSGSAGSSGDNFWAWADRGGGTLEDEASALATLQDGSVYVAGKFEGSAQFGGETFEAPSGSTHIFLTKYASGGDVLWAKSAGGVTETLVFGVATLDDGSVYTTGSFRDEASFGAATLVANGLVDMFLTLYDPSGNVRWATNAGGDFSAAGASVALLDDGGVFVTGIYQGTATFGATKLSSAGLGDVFLAKFDRDGKALWAKSAGGSGIDGGDGVAVGPKGSIYVSGSFSETALFGEYSVISNGGQDAFLAKFDADGEVVWVTRAGGAGTESPADSVAVLADGSAYVAGYFTGTAIFGTASLTNAGGTDAFLVKYDAAGQAMWARGAGGPENDYGTGVVAFDDGSTYMTGSFRNTATFDAITLTAPDENRGFLVKYGSEGDLLWAKYAGDLGSSQPSSVAALSDGSAYVAGSFSPEVVFGKTELTSLGMHDAFVAKCASDGQNCAQ